ncbi:molecular chaperone TorD family protein [Desulfuromonas acetexigens]|uniref:Molecular chaperone TorD family protein n=1 Tax=Trichloromonas acetexigens TaxID=38815 RepID=A0A550J520_9BACT|nr:molecular chaperone TorD family protein [Desulfuromonas acetexigens]
MLHVSERKQLYRFLAGLFAYPDQELVTALARGEAAEAVRLTGFEEAPPVLAEDDPLAELEAGFTDLFINRLGGVPAPPYGSIYLEQAGILMGASTLKVLDAYRREGLSLEGSGEPPDYLATELEFLYYLVGQEEEALQQRQVEAARDFSLKQRAFVSELLSPWLPVFCRRLEAAPGGHPLYLWGGRLLQRFGELEEDWLKRLP